ncbi:MATE family efflux transporter [Allosphingosinicella indica]|uniref:Multidrug resistance protein, MATE family n=1 Tax=Allosphingosinicella indica TaxID=941907 RepID=A0A1X7G4R4_9SPHN|nr:MATE family efflux transporter [Allosphingosinicella indica]SMF63933.1 multidrug resistance protein, MATE family [Allosphingosinicella indica]
MRYNRRDIVEEAGRILRLAWPIMLTGLNWTLMHLIDVAIVGHMSTAELGALAASRTLTFITIVMGLAGLSGVLVHVSRADGGGRLAETGDLLRAGAALGLTLGFGAFVILMLFAEPLLMLVGVSADLQGPGAAVVRAISFGYLGQFVLAAASYFLEGISRPRRVMAVNLAMLPVNAVLAWALVGGHLGFPALGAVGAALATASVSVGGGIAMLVLCWLLPRAAERGVHDLSAAALRRAFAWLPRLAGFGVVPGIAAGLELAGFSWLMALSTQLGIVAAGAFQAMFSLHNIVFTLAIGFGSAAGVRVGNAVGAGEPEEAWPRTMIAAGLALLMLGALSATFWLFAVPLTAPFSDDRAVTSLAAVMLALIAPFMLFDGLQYVMGYALRSLGEQVWAGVNSIFAFFVVTGGLGWWLVREGYGPAGLVYAAGAGMVLAALLQFARLVLVVRRIGRS